MLFKTKAKTLENLSTVVKCAGILPQICFTKDEWEKKSSMVLHRIKDKNWLSIPLIVRSSSLAEDTDGESQAGRYKSVLNVSGEKNIVQAVKGVINSYSKAKSIDQVFIQPMLQDVDVSGVAFSLDPNTGAPYIVINYDDTTGCTNTVTSGKSKDLKTSFWTG